MGSGFCSAGRRSNSLESGVAFGLELQGSDLRRGSASCTLGRLVPRVGRVVGLLVHLLAAAGSVESHSRSARRRTSPLAACRRQQRDRRPQSVERRRRSSVRRRTADHGRRPSRGPGRRVLEHARGRGGHRHARRRSPIRQAHRSAGHIIRAPPSRGLSLGRRTCRRRAPCAHCGRSYRSRPESAAHARTSWRPRAGCSSICSTSRRCETARRASLTEDRGNAILSTLPLSDLTAIELPLESQRRVALQATVTVDRLAGR